MSHPALEATFNSSLLRSRSCQTFARSIRSFASTPTYSNIPPESPRYIEVPQPVQEDYQPKPRVKGTLPVPRELFPRRRPDKPSRFYREDATPEPKSRSEDIREDLPHAEAIAWRKRMASVRRKNLREGLVELYRRKQRTDRAIAQRSEYKAAERDHLITQAEREDERLTNSTVIQEMMLVRGAEIPDPNREQRLATKRANAEAQEARKLEERKDALQTLYLNARNFITNEQQLQAEIDRVFPETNNPAWRSENRPGDNIWNIGLPPSIGDMLKEVDQGDLSLSQGSAKHADLAQKRIRKIADVLGFKS
jgi:hypothetical protein